ncbi:bifunctional diguanylate cyclase/phosphodiesterase, partial [Photobacterium sp. OFAV2-7]|uniref:putative bifunctional diguanylate cyclase/phosphodiesterase n=1 Tax=Photobacterium sp. OFAV2-7 TaxID=2917748 RepID=UPI001EF42F4E
FDIGDNYLWVLGKTLQERLKDKGLVVRYSNAKFGVLVEENNGLTSDAFDEYVHQICRRLCDVAAMPLKLKGGHQVNKSFSIGVSAESAVYDSYHAMEVATEIAMREAKKFSTSKYCLATEQTKDDLVFKKLIIEELPQAIEQNQIKIYFQPQYDLCSGALIGFEALSRWQHNELGYIPPDVFVGVAEDIGLHFEFDLWVFNQVCRQIVEWREHGINTPRIAINISFKTIEMTTFVSRIIEIINTTQCPTELIEVEITETATAKNISMLRDNITQLKSAGINIAVDDFGTGYSSLNLIRTFCRSLDKLKLDRTLIENICNTELDREFTRQIIELSRVLQVKVLAEGVETQEQRELLTQLGCDCAQGYYFDKALPTSEAQALIDRACFSADCIPTA